MNFLAHLLLAEDDPLARVGCLYPDLALPKEKRGYQNLPEKMQQAIAQHLAIDAFTDLHPIVARSKSHFRGAGAMGGRLAGVLVDVFYDHILAREWEKYHPLPLQQFIAQVHRDIRENLHWLPQTMRFPLDRMLSENWLSCYATVEGIFHVLTLLSRRFSQRLGRPVAMQKSVPDLLRHLPELTQDFREFFPLLQQACPVPSLEAHPLARPLA